MYLVIDIGGTFVKYALMSRGGDIISKKKKPMTRESLEAFEEVIFSIIEEQELEAIRGIAISVPGTVDVDTGVIYYGGSFPFLHEVNLVERINQKYGIGVAVENDAKCAALAELWLGSAKEKKDAVVLVLGSGVGGGIIINGELHRGVNLSAGEVSYVMNRLDNETREAGYFGFDCSAVEMVRKVAKLKQLEDETDGEKAFEYINNRDPEAMKVLDNYCLQLAAQVLNLQYIIDPEIVAIGGGISAQPILFERLDWAMAEIKQKNALHMAEPNIVACQFLSDANLYGALYHFFVNKEKLLQK